MVVSRRFTLIAAMLALSGLARAEDAEPVDEEFLEFLGTLDTEDEGLADFLASDESLGAPAEKDAAQADKAKADTAKKVKTDEE
jgi:hypothetical protein